ncbi:MAG TPA: hypothetical protein DEQ02_04100 [Ruminococcaceae bacterium]|nr:hypothetical protein [Oscillospiraceae bacterium]
MLSLPLNVYVKPGDRIITLSSCTYAVEDGCYIIMARKRRPREDYSVDVEKTEKNETPLGPKEEYVE